MKKIKTLLLTVLLVAVAFSAFACQTDIVISFNTNGGAEISSVKLQKDEAYTLPTPDARVGFEFEGWYASSNFAGEPVTEIVAKNSSTFYAKWTQLYKITLQVGDGTLAQTELYVKAGENVLEALSDYAPTKADHILGAWLNGTTEVTDSFQMPENDLTLTAKYKIRYTVEYYLQNINDDNYTKQAEDGIAYGYVGEVATSTESKQGFTLITHANSVSSVTLTSTVANNVIKLYYNRQTRTATFKVEYPQGTTQPDLRLTARHGGEIEVPVYETAGYYLKGWKTQDGTVQFNTDYINVNSYDNFIDGIVAESATFSITSNITLYPVWVKGYIDIFGGEDIVYLDEVAQKVYVHRSKMFFIEGPYIVDESKFRIRELVSDQTVLTGKIFDDGTYAYESSERAGQTCTLYVNGTGLVPDVVIRFDYYNGITYEEKIDGAIVTSTGTYSVDSIGFYTATFTGGTGSMAGKTIIFITGQAGGTFAFQICNKDEIDLGTLLFFYVDGNTLKYEESELAITMNGYGVASIVMSGVKQNYYYTYDSVNEIVVLTYGSAPYITGKLVREHGVTGYAIYTEFLKYTYTNGADTLTLDGMYGATYKHGSYTYEGFYTMKTSVLGKLVVTFRDKNDVNNEFTFMVDILTKRFSDANSSYAEFYYQDVSGRHDGPLLALTSEDEAYVYAYTATGKYQIVSEGTYAPTGTEGMFTYTETNAHDVPEALTKPIDFETIKSFTFATNEIGGYQIYYWYSYTTKANQTINNPVKEYISTEGDGSKLTFIAGIATLEVDIEGEKLLLAGSYNTEGTLVAISTDYGAFYVEIDDNNLTYTEVQLPSKSTLLTEAGTEDKTTTLELDGRGGATYTYQEDDVTYTVKGTAASTGTITIVGTSIIYRFVANDGSITFDFITLTASTLNIFAKFNPDHYGEYKYVTEKGTAKLVLDGFAFLSQYTDENGVVMTADRYLIASNGGIYVYNGDNITCFKVTDNVAKTVIRLGAELGAYPEMKNGIPTTLRYELDGANNLRVYKIHIENGKQRIEIIATGTYEKDGDQFILRYELDGEDLTVYGSLTTYYENGTPYKVFTQKNVTAVRTYVDPSTWVVMILDQFGGAVRFNEFGVREEGSYTLITNSILHYMSNDGTYANIFNFNKATGEISSVKFSAVGYYTQELESLLFSAGGMVTFGKESHYYSIEEDIVYIYRRLAEGESTSGLEITEFGFVRTRFGTFERVKEFYDEIFYKNNGFAVSFARDVNDTYDDNGVAKLKFPIEVDTGNFSPAGEIIFAPSAGVFIASATVKIATISYPNGAVFRGENQASNRLYFSIGYFVFEIEVSYLGEDNQGNNLNTYKIINMTYEKSLVASDFYAFYYTMLHEFGENYANNMTNKYGDILVKRIYNEDGTITEGNQYIEGNFGDSSHMIDSQGNIVREIKPDSYDEDGNLIESGNIIDYIVGKDPNNKDIDIHLVLFTAPDGLTYKLTFKDILFSPLSKRSYSIFYMTRVDTLYHGDYKFVIEKVANVSASIAEGSDAEVGEVVDVKIYKKNGVGEYVIDTPAITSTTTMGIYTLSSERYYVVYRTKDNTGIITGTKAYIISLRGGQVYNFNSKEPGILPYDASKAQIEMAEFETLYSADKLSYIDRHPVTGEIHLVVYQGSLCVIENVVLNADGSYTINAIVETSRNQRTFKVTIGDNDTITIVRI